MTAKIEKSTLSPYQNWRVKVEGIHPLKKLIYLNKEEFRLLRKLRKSFLKRARLFFKKAPKQDSSPREYRLKRFIRDDLRKNNDNTYPSYEATNISLTRDSLFWRWRRVKEYYKDFLGIDNNLTMKEVYRLADR